MSARDSATVATSALTLEQEYARRQGLRIAMAAATGLVLSIAAGLPLPFFASLFAVQFLVGSRRPMPLGKAVGMLLLVVGVSEVLVLAVALAGTRPLVLAPLLWLLYFACFVAQARDKGAQASVLVLLVGAMVPLMEILHVDLGSSMSKTLAIGVASAALLVWAAHFVMPNPPGMEAEAEATRVSPDYGLHRPIANASILLLAMVVCLSDSRLSAAMVIPVTVAAVLGQADLAKSKGTALGLVVINTLGGIAASLAFVIVEIRPDLLTLFLVTLFAGVLFGAGASDPRSGKIYAGALTIFVTLLGLGLSPLSEGTPESFTTRITYVCAAVLVTLWACLLIWPRQSIHLPNRKSPTDTPV